MDLANTLRPEWSLSGVPVILTAAGVGPALAAHVRGVVQSFGGAGAGTGTGGRPGAEEAAVAWAALRCLRHAAETGAQAVAACGALLQAAELELEASAASEGGNGGGGGEGRLDLQLLYCSALSTMAALLALHDPARLAALAATALALVVAHPGSFHILGAAADTLSRARAAGVPLSTAQLRELLPLLQGNLSAASGPLRRTTLRLLCCFDMPALLPSAGAEEAGGPPAPPQECDALRQLLAVEERQHGADSGRPAGVSPGDGWLAGWMDG